MPDYYIERENMCLGEYGIEFFRQIHTSSGDSTRSHIHPAIEFIYIESGVYSISADNAQVTASKGDLLFFRANTIHSLSLTDHGKGICYVLKIHPSFLFYVFPGKDQKNFTSPFLVKRRGERFRFCSSDLPDNSMSILENMIALLDDEENPEFYITERIYASLFLLEILHILPPCTNEESNDINEKNISMIYESISYINNNYSSDISAEECAEMAHISYSYFARLFRAIMGRTFKEYLIGLRLAKAHGILMATSLPITDVASLCGYPNLSYFISEYKNLYGKTPGQARQGYKSMKKDPNMKNKEILNDK